MQKYALEVTKLIETKGGYALERRLSNGVEIIERPGAREFYVAEVDGYERNSYVEVEVKEKHRKKILKEMMIDDEEPDKYRFVFDHNGHILVMVELEGMTETELYYDYI